MMTILAFVQGIAEGVLVTMIEARDIDLNSDFIYSIESGKCQNLAHTMCMQ